MTSAYDVRGLSPDEKMQALVDRQGPDECWDWTAGRTALGYGFFRYQGKRYYAHRWAVGLGPGDDGVAMHTCDRPPCCNPAHIVVGTQQENIRDAIEKGRMGRKVGSKDSKPRPRKATCHRGHLLSGENLYEHEGRRHCRQCRREYAATHR